MAFYRALFGWDVNEAPIGPDGVYSMFTMRGKEVAAGYTMRRGTSDRSATALESLCHRGERGREREEGRSAGAKVRAALRRHGRRPDGDTTGSDRRRLRVWQAKLHIGAKILNEPGALCWSELTTRDPKKRRRSTRRSLDGRRNTPRQVRRWSTEFSNQGKLGVGLMEMPKQMPPRVPSYWMPYFQVDDCDGSVARRKA